MMADWAWTSVTKALPPDNLLVLITVEIGNKRGTAFGFMRDGEWKSEVLTPTVHAHWAVVPQLFNKKDDTKTYRCTNCNKVQVRSLAYPNYCYCPYCGAKMDGKEPE